MDLVNVREKFEAHIALSVSEIIAIAVLVRVANPQSWGREGRRGSGWYRSKDRW